MVTNSVPPLLYRKSLQQRARSLRSTSLTPFDDTLLRNRAPHCKRDDRSFVRDLACVPGRLLLDTGSLSNFSPLTVQDGRMAKIGGQISASPRCVSTERLRRGPLGTPVSRFSDTTVSIGTIEVPSEPLRSSHRYSSGNQSTRGTIATFTSGCRCLRHPAPSRKGPRSKKPGSCGLRAGGNERTRSLLTRRRR